MEAEEEALGRVGEFSGSFGSGGWDRNLMGIEKDNSDEGGYGDLVFGGEVFKLGVMRFGKEDMQSFHIRNTFRADIFCRVCWIS